MLIKRGWNKYVDEMRDDLIKNDPTIIIKEFEFLISLFLMNAKIIKVCL